MLNSWNPHEQRGSCQIAGRKGGPKDAMNMFLTKGGLDTFMFTQHFVR